MVVVRVYGAPSESVLNTDRVFHGFTKLRFKILDVLIQHLTLRFELTMLAA